MYLLQTLLGQKVEVGTYHSIIKSLNAFTLKAGIEKINEIEKSAQ